MTPVSPKVIPSSRQAPKVVVDWNSLGLNAPNFVAGIAFVAGHTTSRVGINPRAREGPIHTAQEHATQVRQVEARIRLGGDSAVPVKITRAIAPIRADSCEQARKHSVGEESPIAQRPAGGDVGAAESDNGSRRAEGIGQFFDQARRHIGQLRLLALQGIGRARNCWRGRIAAPLPTLISMKRLGAVNALVMECPPVSLGPMMTLKLPLTTGTRRPCPMPAVPSNRNGPQT